MLCRKQAAIRMIPSRSRLSPPHGYRQSRWGLIFGRELGVSWSWKGRRRVEESTTWSALGGENQDFRCACTELPAHRLACVAGSFGSTGVGRYPTSSLINALGLRMFLRCQSGREFLAKRPDLWCSKRKMAPDRMRDRFRAATVLRTWQ